MNWSPDRELVEDVARKLKLRQTFIEKDFAVARMLSAIAKTEVPGFRFVFGGGTALARAHRVIQRMSEDVDLKLIQVGQVNPSQSKKRKSELKRQIVAVLQGAGFEIDLERDVKARNANSYILFTVRYPGRTERADILRPHIQLELMVSELRRPTVDLSVRSFVAEATNETPEVATIACISLTETAAEKMISLTRRIALAQESGGTREFDRALIRHVYDLHAILDKIDQADARALYRELIANDVAQYGNQHPVFNADPEKATFRALDELEANWRHRHSYADFMGNMVFSNKFLFDEALETVKALVSDAWGRKPTRPTPSADLWSDMVNGTAYSLTEDASKTTGFAEALRESNSLTLDLSPEVVASIPVIEEHLPEIGYQTVEQFSGYDIQSRSDAARALTTEAATLAAQWVAAATWKAIPGYDHIVDERIAVEMSLAVVGRPIFRVLVDGEVVRMTNEAAELHALSKDELLT